MNKLFYLLTLLFITKICKAQLNESDTATSQLKLSITVNYQQGNVDVLTIRSKIDATHKIGKLLMFKTQNNSLYQAFYGNKSDNDLFSRNYLYYKPQNKFYPFAIAYVSANYRRKIDSRYFAGAGVTYQLLDTKSNTIKLAASMVYEETKFNGNHFNFENYNQNNIITNWRSTAYIAGWHYIADKKIRFMYDAFWQPSLNDNNNFRTQFDVGIEMPILKGLSFNMLYTFTHENVVISSVKQDDKILTFGLSYNLKKQ